jgi:hypothetical protein
LVDRFDFLDNYSKNAAAHGDNAPMPAAKQAAATSVRWYLGTIDAWVSKFFPAGDLRNLDKALLPTARLADRGQSSGSCIRIAGEIDSGTFFRLDCRICGRRLLYQK